MLTLEQIKRTETRRRTYGSGRAPGCIGAESGYGTNIGSCFGITDPSRLRGSNPPPISREEDKYVDGKICIEAYGHLSNLLFISLIDKELSNGLKARVAYSFNGTEEAIADWTKDKVHFSDLETRTLQYIVKRF